MCNIIEFYVSVKLPTRKQNQSQVYLETVTHEVLTEIREDLSEFTKNVAVIRETQKWKTTDILGPQGERRKANYVRNRSNSRWCDRALCSTHDRFQQP